MPASFSVLSFTADGQTPLRGDALPRVLGLRPDQLGILLIGHGTRSTIGQQEFLATVAGVARHFEGSLVRPCFLELVEPSIDAAIDELVERGVTHVAVAPLLLFAAGHAKRDVPAAIEAARMRHPRVHFSVAAHLGCHPRLLELSAVRFEAAERMSGESPAVEADAQEVRKESRTNVGGARAWVLVGRGSLDPTAWAETERFLNLRRSLTPVNEARVAYLAMAAPKLAETLAELGPHPYDTVVVQPHLLFAGDLLEQVSREVTLAAERFPRVVWRLAAHCGVAEAVVEAVVERIHEAQTARGIRECAQTANGGEGLQ